ncbi:MAG: glycosyltransferase family 4 protein [Fusicatenibacter sp.]|nr:glycosyltransferase family 4 protein [Fusicatenibacter sp.]
MKKVLILTNHSYMLYQFRRELVQKLMEDCKVVLSMPYVGHESDFLAMGCQCIETEVDRRGINPVTDSRLLWKYLKILRKEKPDLVVTYSIKPNIYGGLSCSLLGIPYCANVQGLGTAFQKKGLAAFVTLLYKAAFHRVKTVFFENEENAAEFCSRNILSRDRQVILHGAGVNLEHYACRPYPKDGQIHFLYLGRIMREKGVEELFGAMRRLKEKYGEGVILDIVGFFEDEYREIVEELQEKQIAVFHGFQSETRPYYEAAHCVVLPSYHEGMSNVLLEASSCARPIITSDIPGCREAVEDGKTGYLCRVKDTDSLYQKMEQFLELTYEDKRQMGLMAREKMKTEFDKAEIVNETVRVIYEKI